MKSTIKIATGSSTTDDTSTGQVAENHKRFHPCCNHYYDLSQTSATPWLTKSSPASSKQSAIESTTIGLKDKALSWKRFTKNTVISLILATLPQNTQVSYFCVVKTSHRSRNIAYDYFEKL